MPKYLTLLTLVFSLSLIAAEQQPSKEAENKAQSKAKTIKNKKNSKQVEQSLKPEPTALLFIPDYLKPIKEPAVGC